MIDFNILCTQIAKTHSNVDITYIFVLSFVIDHHALDKCCDQIDIPRSYVTMSVENMLT